MCDRLAVELVVQPLTEMSHAKPPMDLAQLVQKLAGHDIHGSRQRCVVLTRGSQPILVSVTGQPDVRQFPVREVPLDEIVDTNCAGDAFVGGFLGHLAQYVRDEAEEQADVCSLLSQSSLLSRCVNEGIMYARLIVRVSGCNLDQLKAMTGR